MSQSKTKKTKEPKLRTKKNRSGGTCYATFNGVKEWFGRADDPQTQVRFAARRLQWWANGRKPEEVDEDVAGLTVREVVARYVRHLEEKYDADWHRRNEVRLRLALDALLTMHGRTPAAEFSPKRLKAVRHSMIATKALCRSEINARVQIQRKAFKWAASDELVPASVWHGLQAVDHLLAGEFGVREGKPRGPVAEDVVFATLPHLHPVAAALVELLWHVGVSDHQEAQDADHLLRFCLITSSSISLIA